MMRQLLEGGQLEHLAVHLHVRRLTLNVSHRTAPDALVEGIVWVEPAGVATQGEHVVAHLTDDAGIHEAPEEQVAVLLQERAQRFGVITCVVGHHKRLLVGQHSSFLHPQGDHRRYAQESSRCEPVLTARPPSKLSPARMSQWRWYAAAGTFFPARMSNARAMTRSPYVVVVYLSAC